MDSGLLLRVCSDGAPGGSGVLRGPAGELVLPLVVFDAA